MAILAAPRSAEANPKQAEECADKETAQKKNYADLQLAARAAETAEHATYLVYQQTCIAIVGVLLVVLTFSVTAWAAVAAAKAAKAAEKAVTVASETAQRELRAYVFVASWAARPIRLGYMISAVLENNGNTPARHCMASISYKLFPTEGLPSDFSYPDEEARTATAIGPRTEIESAGIPLSDEEILLARVTEQRPFVWGWIEYSDIFDARHRTEFCVEIFFDAGRDGDGLQFEFAKSGPFNGSDDDCMRQPKSYEKKHL